MIHDIQQNLSGLHAEIQACEINSGRTPGSVKLIAVSKTKPVEDIATAAAAGQVDFGENKVQELAEKAPQFPEIRWHLIGHLQTNKVKYIVPFVYLIHSVDSTRLLQEIEKQAAKVDRVIACLLQINISNEAQKSGMEESEAEDILKMAGLFPHVQFIGLMGIAELTEDQEKIRAQFARLREAREKFRKYNGTNVTMTELSMGMSDDFPIAIDEGATYIRVGSRIFGARDYTQI